MPAKKRKASGGENLPKRDIRPSSSVECDPITLIDFLPDLFWVEPAELSFNGEEYVMWEGKAEPMVKKLRRKIKDMKKIKKGNLIVQSNKEVWFDIPPLLCSTKNRPDVWVSTADEILVLNIEVHSEDYENSVAKTAANCVDQLRVLRNLNPSITRISGFTFPKAECPKYVTKVDVEWADLGFTISLTPLLEDAVEAEVMETLQANFSAVENLSRGMMPDRPTILPLSRGELKLIATSMGGKEAKQIPSNSSIVVRCAGKYIKYNPKVAPTLWDWVKSKVVVQSEGSILIGRLRFSIYPEVEQMTRRDIVEGGKVFEYITNVSFALETLHTIDNIAHLDVRFENICFSANGDVKFIDFDRYLSARGRPNLYFGIYKAEMYRCEGPKWTAAQLDWKQFGILVANLVIPPKQRDKPLESSWLKGKPEMFKFLTSLITKGQYNHEQLAACGANASSWPKDLIRSSSPCSE